jgi:hypothetical protein
LIATLTSIYYATNEVMADSSFLHLTNTIVQFLWWIMFTMCLLKNPGVVVDFKKKNINNNSNNNNNNSSSSSINNTPQQQQQQQLVDNSYSSALDIIGAYNGSNTIVPPIFPAVCHTCRVRKTLRSKHCKLKRRCVQKFDHFWFLILLWIVFFFLF